MTITEIRIFKSDLKVLPVLEQAYKDALQEIEEIDYQMQGVHGIDPSKEHIQGKHSDIRNTLIPIKDQISNRAEKYKNRIDATYSILNRCPDKLRSYLVDIYVKKRATTMNVAVSNYLSESTLRRRIISELSDIDV